MRVGELIRALEDVQSRYGDAEVRVASASRDYHFKLDVDLDVGLNAVAVIDIGEDEAVLAARAAGNDPFAGFDEAELNAEWDRIEAALEPRE